MVRIVVGDAVVQGGPPGSFAAGGAYRRSTNSGRPARRSIIRRAETPDSIATTSEHSMESDDDSLSELSDVSDKPKVKRPVKAASTTSYVSKRPTKRELAESEPLDFSTIRTSAPIRLPPRSRPRLFGLEHCPVYYPTEEEFADPITCIQRYARDSQSAQAGIFKVVPPSTWKPPFVLDTQTFRFKTRVQRLNSMEASARATLNFLEQLYLFHSQQNKTKVTIPSVGGKPVNLWRLRKEVAGQGGHAVVSKERQWAHIARLMGYHQKAAPQMAGQLKFAYYKVIAPFEEYKSRFETKPSDSPKLGSTSSSSGGMRSMPAQTSLASAAITSEEVKEAHIRLSDALNASPDLMPSCISTDASALETGFKTEDDNVRDQSALKTGDFCEVCGGDHDEANILLCDDCDKGYHLQCLEPPLDKVPNGNWICDECIVHTGADYGFEEGQEHSFATFQRRAASFRRKYLSAHPACNLIKESDAETALMNEITLEDHLEREFWKLVESQKENVDAEYGADLHTTVWGSGIATTKTHPDNEYAKHPWNLNNIATLKGSLLRHVNKDISGMTVPWGYVGQALSTFAWHKEDHYTYSVNYHHWGGTKTWYGVPGEDDVKLEAAMKSAAPELFQEQPDLLYQLVTLMSPGRLKRAGVRICVCDQRPGEYVITLPKAYHAGFNHDFNYNEAVNFCLPDWLEHDLTCVKRYKQMGKNPVFSHDELLISIFRHDDTMRTAQWLLPHFQEMVDRELLERQSIRKLVPNVRETVETSTPGKDHHQCRIDHSYCYLSHVTCVATEGVICIEHAKQDARSVEALFVRMSDDDLLAMLALVRKRSLNEPAAEKPASKHHIRDAEIPHFPVIKRMRLIVRDDAKAAAVSLANGFSASSPPSARLQRTEQTAAPSLLLHV